MQHGVIWAGQTSWDAREEACWQQDSMNKLHNDDALWAYAMRAPEELRMLDQQCLNNNTIYHLLCMGIYDWKGKDKLLNQAGQAVHLSSAMSTRFVEVEPWLNSSNRCRAGTQHSEYFVVFLVLSCSCQSSYELQNSPETNWHNIDTHTSLCTHPHTAMPRLHKDTYDQTQPHKETGTHKPTWTHHGMWWNSVEQPGIPWNSPELSGMLWKVLECHGRWQKVTECDRTL